ncbi:hypothetical protein ACT17S_11370 [Glutamicibacter mysorens]
MSNLPGNPHANVNVDFADTNDGRINGEAILALAYEQRTRNLIALLDTPAGRLTLLDEGDEAMDMIQNQIKSRLGLGDNNA